MKVISKARQAKVLALWMLLERVMGIEPTFSAWEADVLPLNYTRAASNYTQ